MGSSDERSLKPATDIAIASSLIASMRERVPTIMVVDDDRRVLATLSLAIRDAGFSTIEVDNGSSALELCVNSPPSLVVLDYDLPGLSGIELAEKWNATRAFPYIFLSACADDAPVHRAVQAGAMAYLVKPIDPIRLIPTIHACLQRFSELSRLRGESLQLNAARQAARDTNVVVGLLMERLRLTETEAYNRLRQYSRGQSRRIADVATEILSACQTLNQAVADIGLSTGKSKHRVNLEL